MARASMAQGWSQIGADVDLVDAMKIALVLKKERLQTRVKCIWSTGVSLR